MFLNLGFPSKDEEDRFAHYLLSKRGSVLWWDIMRDVIGLAAISKHVAAALKDGALWGTALAYCFMVPANILESIVAQKEIGSWRFRTWFGILVSIFNSCIPAFYYDAVFPPKNLEGWQMLGPSMAGSFWVFFHLNRFSPATPFRFQYLYFGSMALIHLAGLRNICRTQDSLQWLGTMVFRLIFSLISFLPKKLHGPELANRLSSAIDGPEMQCVLSQATAIMFLGFLWSSYLYFNWELRVRKSYARDCMTSRVSKRMLRDTTCGTEYFLYFGLPGVFAMLLFSFYIGLFEPFS